MSKLNLFLFIIIISGFQTLKGQNQFWQLYSLYGKEVVQFSIDRQKNYYAIVKSDTVNNYALYKSENSGTSWANIFTPTPCPSGWIHLKMMIDTTNINFDKIYLMIQYGTSICSDSLFYSTNYGNSWNNFPLPDDKPGEIAFNSAGDLFVAIPSEKIIFSTDNGNTWELLIDSSYFTLTRVVIDRSGFIYTNKWFFDPTWGNWEHIYRSTDTGNTWEMVVSTYWGTDYFQTFESLPSGEIYGADQGHMYLKRNNYNWSMINGVLSPRSLVINNYRHIYASSLNFNSPLKIRYSPDYGVHWFSIANDDLSDIIDLGIDDDGYLIAATPGGIYRSNESTYPIINKAVINFPDTKLNDSSYIEIALQNPLNTQLIVDSLSSSTNSYSMDLSMPVYIMPGDSVNTQLRFTPDRLGSFNDTLVLSSNLKTQNIYVFAKSPLPELRCDTDVVNFGGVTIQDTLKDTIIVFNTDINTIRIDSMYFLRNMYFYISDNDFPKFIDQNDSLGIEIYFVPLGLYWKHDTLRIASNAVNSPLDIHCLGQGRNPSRNNPDAIKKLSFSLLQNNPNPFNPVTNIQYEIPEYTFITLMVYDVLGKEVRTLVNEEKPAGGYSIEFDGSNLPSGIYFYKLSAGNFLQVKKMLLLK